MRTDHDPACQQNGSADTQSESQRNYDCRGRTLRSRDIANDIAGNDEHPGILVGKLSNCLGQKCGLRADEDVHHPAQAQRDDCRKHTGTEHGHIQNDVGLLIHENTDHCSGNQHENLNDIGHSHGAAIAQNGTQRLDNAQQNDTNHGRQEHNHGQLGLLAELGSVDLLALGFLVQNQGAIRNTALELGIISQLLALLQHNQTGSQGAQQGGRNHNHQNLDHIDAAGLFQEANQCCRGSCQRGAANGILAGYNGCGNGTLGTDAVLNRDFIDNGQQTPQNVAGAAAEYKQPADKGSNNRDGLGMLSHDFLSQGNQVFNTTRCLHGTTGDNHCQNDTQNGNRGVGHGSLKNECENKCTDTTGKCQENATFAHAPSDEEQQNC